MTRSGLSGYQVMSGFRLISKRNKRKRSIANHSCRSEPPRPAEISNQFSSFCPVGPVAPAWPSASLIPSSISPVPASKRAEILLYTYCALLTPPLNLAAPWQSPGPRLAREEQPHLGMCSRHLCMCGGDSPSPLLVCRVSDWKSSPRPRPRPLRAQRMAGPAGEVRGANFLSWAEFSPAVHADDSG